MKISYRAPGVGVNDNLAETAMNSPGPFVWDSELADAVADEIHLGLPPGSLRTRIVDARKMSVVRAQNSRVAPIPFQDNSPVERTTRSTSTGTPKPRKRAKSRAVEKWSGVIASVTPENFASILPARPYCTDWMENGVKIRPRAQAVKYRYVQINHLSSRITALVLDLDYDGASLAWKEAGLPQPNIMSINPENGHAHATYFLRSPVLTFEQSRDKPLSYFRAVQRGYIRRLNADSNYSGMIAKNPLHTDWRTIWGRSEPYTLAELDAPLDYEDKAPIVEIALEMGFGRNCAVFDKTRRMAYRVCNQFKREGRSLDEWMNRVKDDCGHVNAELPRSLSPNELHHIAKSIAKWTWRKFNGVKFSERQRQRVARRWQDHVKVEPWVALGMSRSTYFRRKARRLPEAPPACSPGPEGAVYGIGVTPQSPPIVEPVDGRGEGGGSVPIRISLKVRKNPPRGGRNGVSAIRGLGSRTVGGMGHQRLHLLGNARSTSAVLHFRPIARLTILPF